MKTIGIIIGLSLGLFVGPAFGQHYGHHHGPRYRPYHPPIHHHHHHQRRNNYAPYVAGAIGLGIMGAIIADQYARRCYKQHIGYDHVGNPIFEHICK